jgi:hypothetical protein
MNRALLCFTLCGFFAACECGKVEVVCSTNAECSSGTVCIAGRCTGGAGGGGGGGSISMGCDPKATDNATRDTDCDGIPDSDEYNSIVSGNSGKTDPCNSDTDGDGIPDGVELSRTATPNASCGAKFVADADPTTHSDPTNADTDGDGVKDGVEDPNHNGKIDPGECSLNLKDTDCDGISDSDELAGTLGCKTDCQKIDTDDDGLPDGTEQGLQQPGADPANCKYTPIFFDTDPSTKTLSCTGDTDGDGIQDGAEDGNHNGKVDPGELDPKLGSDGMGPAQQACAVANLKPITFQGGGKPDVKVALVPGFSEVGRLADTSERGLIFYDAAAHIAGLVLSKPPDGTTGTTEEQAGRAKLQATGGVSGPITQTFTTWDGFDAVRGTYDNAGAVDLKTRINDLAKAYLGQTVTGLLSGTAGVTGPFKIQAEFVHRTNMRSVVVIAIVPAANYTGQSIFELDDTGGGSALAQFRDYSASTCEVFLADINAKVDFLWVVDDSGSMAAYQAAIGNAATAFSTKLATAGLDWRAGAITTGYSSMTCTPGTSPFCYRPFTSDAPTMTSWFSSAGGATNWFGTGGNPIESALASAQSYMPVLLPKTVDPLMNKVRTGAALHLIHLGDADDQATSAIATVIAFFNSYDGAGSKAVLHGIVCPQGQVCGETNTNPRRNLAVIAATGGVLGDINVAQTGSAQLAATIDAILAAAINGTGHQLLKPPISSTIKIAIETGGTKGACNTADVPRDRTNGFDFDSASRRIVFFGNCIPSAAGKKVAVSYQYWIDATPDPNGICPSDCGGCPANKTCDTNTCECVGIN